MQNYEAQGGIVKGKQQSVRGYCGNLQNNTDVLRSNFSGDNFPNSPVEGQHCFRTDFGIEFIYTKDGWVENDGNGSTSKELRSARGSHDSLKARLDVALNDDGTLKAGAEINMNEWKESLMTPSYLDDSRFHVPNDVVSVFNTGRALKITNKDKVVLTYVDSSQYDETYNRTIVTTTEAVVASSISKVELSIIQHSMPKTAATVKQMEDTTKEIYKHDHTEGMGSPIPAAGIQSGAIINEKLANEAVTGDKIAPATITADKLDPRVLNSKDLDVRSTGFKNHIASGMGVEIDPVSGCPKVTAGRAFIENKYRDMFDDKVLSDVKNQRGLIYAEPSPTYDKDAVVKFKPFMRPEEIPLIKNVPADDMRFMANFEVPANNAQAVIKDLSEGGCNVPAAGAGAGSMQVQNHTGWNVPYSGQSANAYWYSGDKTWKGIKAAPWSMMLYFIPVHETTDFMPFSFYTSTGYAYNVYFRLYNFDGGDGTWDFGVYNNRYDDTATGNVHRMAKIFKNKPNLVVYECDEESSSIYVNGVLAWRMKATHTFVEATLGRICVNNYAYSPGSCIGNMIPLFACIRNGVWGESAISQIANQMGVPNEHVCYEGKVPTLYSNETSPALYKNYHAWSFAETQGNTVYDENKVLPLHGVTSKCTRVPSDGREGLSVCMQGGGFVNFGNHSLGDEYSFFALITAYADGTIASNYNGSYGGYIFDISSRTLRLWRAGWVGYQSTVPFGSPFVVGFTIKKSTGTIKIYMDSTEPQTDSFTPHAQYSDSAPFYIGQHGNGSWGNLSVHAAVMADKVFSEGEIRAIFRSFKKRKYKNMADDMGLSDKAVIGMVKTDTDGKAEIVETCPRWGRRINPYKGKYFLGWYRTNTSKEYTIPNLYGSARAAVNVYVQADKGSPVIKYAGGQIIDPRTATTVVTGRAGSVAISTPVGFDLLGANSTQITYYATQQAVGKEVKNVLHNRLDGVAPWIGLELEPMADNEEVDNSDY